MGFAFGVVITVALFFFYDCPDHYDDGRRVATYTIERLRECSWNGNPWMGPVMQVFCVIQFISTLIVCLYRILMDSPLFVWQRAQQRVEDREESMQSSLAADTEVMPGSTAMLKTVGSVVSTTTDISSMAADKLKNIGEMALDSIGRDVDDDNPQGAWSSKLEKPPTEEKLKLEAENFDQEVLLEVRWYDIFYEKEFWLYWGFCFLSFLGLTHHTLWYVWQVWWFIFDASFIMLFRALHISAPMLVRTIFVALIVFVTLGLWLLVSWEHWIGLDDENAEQCTSLYQCALLVTTLSFSGSDISALFPKFTTPHASFFDIVNANQDWYQHVFPVPIVVFYLIWGILLTNVITGLIIDAFVQIRDVAAAHRDTLKQVCFVCSLDRFSFEQHGINFEEHLEEDHNPLHYLAFVQQLASKSRTSTLDWRLMSGSASRARYTSWIPQKQSLVLNQLESEVNKAGEQQSQTLAAMKESMSNLYLKVDQVSEDIDELSTRVKNGLARRAKSDVELPASPAKM